jgi:hypothetical protein
VSILLLEYLEWEKHIFEENAGFLAIFHTVRRAAAPKKILQKLNTNGLLSHNNGHCTITPSVKSGHSKENSKRPDLLLVFFNADTVI